MGTSAQARTKEDSGTLISDRRRETVDKARQGWIRKLIDLSRRNNLLYYRPLKTGTLDLSAANTDGINALLSGAEPIAVSKLLPNSRDESLLSVLRDIARRAQANAEEKGLQTLFLAMGMATWTADDGGRPAEAPILLVPVTLETKGAHSFHIGRIGGVQTNLVLLHLLESQFGVKLTPEDLLGQLRGDDEPEPFDPSRVFAELRSQARDVPGFDIKVSRILGNFAFQKMAIVRDLREHGKELAAHEVIAAIAGDNDARNSVGSATTDFDPKELDRILPENEFIVLDADSSQQCAISKILAGQNAVIHGPPGTGKSQTIANLVATLAATGHRVLFVAEKRAALEVVLRRLSDIGLGHLAIDLHGADLSPKAVMSHVAQALDRLRNSIPVDCDRIHNQLVDRRTRLNEHVKRIHVSREPTGLSIYEMRGKLLRIDPRAKSKTRWRDRELQQITRKSAEGVKDLLIEAAGFETLFLRTDPSPWAGARLTDGAEVRLACDLVATANSKTFPAFISAIHSLVQSSGLQWPTSLQEAREILRLIATVQTTLEMYEPGVFERSAGLLRELEPGRKGGIAVLWAWISSSAFRCALKTLHGLRKTGKVEMPAVLLQLEKAQQQLSQWQERCRKDSAPRLIDSFSAHQKSCETFFANVRDLSSFFPERNFEQLTPDDIGNLMSRLAEDTQTAAQLPKLVQIEDRLKSAGVSKLVKEIRERKSNNELWREMFQYSWISSNLDAVSETDVDILGFKGVAQTRYVGDFVRLDQEAIAIAGDRVCREHGLRAIDVMNSHPEQQHLIRAESAKGRRHLPLRKVFAQAAEVLTAVCPCWMASPLSVSQLLDGSKQYFDFVVFDEASQILPEDAVAAILRGKKVVVAGDNHQLPPTTFFAASEEDEYAADEDAGASDGFESLLDMMIPFVTSCYLDWHYRSRDEALINFSNQHIYQGRLITFPGPGGPPVITHELVQQELGADGQEESCAAEVRRTVELVVRHASEHPDLTLGVITMGIKHMNRIQAALDRELERNPGIATYFDPSARERFFVKNLERVQGDERDAVIISIGYGKDRAGNLPLRFGPLLSVGGRRRLNVAITRARDQVTVVSSFSHTDIDLARVRPGSGVELLRDYLLYASSNGKRLADGELSSVPLNDFEADIFDALSGQGLRLVPQVGASHFRIDMVAEHPTKPGRFVLAIECDGASYHSSYTARDRDRLRQQQLENLGWRFHRIWSTDWFMRKEDEIKRAMLAFQAAVAYADKLDGGTIHPKVSTEQLPNGKNNGVSEHVQTRRAKPHVPVRSSIAQYSLSELIQWIEWIVSDGRLRTDDEIVAEMISVLGFARRGARIEATIQQALQRYHITADQITKDRL